MPFVAERRGKTLLMFGHLSPIPRRCEIVIREMVGEG